MKSFLGITVNYFVIKTCSENWKISRSTFKSHGLVLILSGDADYKINDINYHAKAGQMVFFTPGCTREAVTKAGMRCIALDFNLENKEGLHFPPLKDFTFSDELKALIYGFERNWLLKPEGYEVKCAGQLLHILYELMDFKVDTNTNIQVERMKRYITDHLDRHFTVAELSTYVQLNPVYCGALFKEHTGLTILSYANTIRIQKASILLEEKDMNLSDIAESCGFSDVYYFSKTFKEIKGQSPSDYRRNLLKQVHH